MTSRGTRLQDSPVPLLENHDAVFLDLDGVVYEGAHVIDGVVETIAAIRAADLPFAFLTNNASRTALDVAEHLMTFEIGHVSPDQVVTAAQAIAHIVATEMGEGAPVLVVGGPGLREPIEQQGLTIVESATDDPVAVVQGYHPDVGWRDLAEASYAIRAGARWFASNADRTIPTGRGIAPGNGALIEAIAIATGEYPVLAGKPHTPVFDEARDRLGCANPIMVGDRIDTDIAGAINARIPVLAVLTGVNSVEDYLELPAGQRPDFLAHDLRGLLEPHPPVGDGASLRDQVAAAWARADDESSSGSATMDA